MISDLSDDHEAYVWVWLPEATAPVVAGRLSVDDRTIVFNYGRSYLDRPEAIPLYLPELPLRRGEIRPPPGLAMPSSIRDASPDAWGRRVILNRSFGRKRQDLDRLELSEMTYLLESGSDRIGALDFQRSPDEYSPRSSANATLDELLESARRVEQGIPLTDELDRALHHGSSIGGARPKALIQDGDRKYVAKFSSTADVYNVVKAEFIAMRLASLAGIDAAPVNLVSASGRNVLLIERFDRIRTDNVWKRKLMVSALTILQLDEMMARYASYSDLATLIRHRFSNPSSTLKELFRRIVFNVLCGNTDDHARNHAAFWDGEALALTPAYDICPQSRTGQEASQAMLISPETRMSRIAACLDACAYFHLSVDEAVQIVMGQIESIGENWQAVCEQADLGDATRNMLWGRQFLNPFAFTELEGEGAKVQMVADRVRGSAG
jgi:serine/threonine-protein kinase HipA